MRNFMYWFSQNSGPEKGALINKKGELVLVNFRSHQDRAKVAGMWDDFLGALYLAPATGKWAGEGPHAVNPSWTVWVPSEFDTPEEARDAFLKKLGEAKQEEEAILADPALHLERELKSHDWFSAYSDSPGVSGAGDHHWDLIQELRKKVPEETYLALVKKHQPVPHPSSGAYEPDDDSDEYDENGYAIIK